MEELLQKLREIYPTLANGQKEAITEAVNTLKNLDKQIRENRQSLPEAPASATVKVVNTTTQMEWLVTVRGYTRYELLQEIAETSKHLADAGFIAFDAYVDQRRAERDTERSSKAANLPPMAQPSAPPQGASGRQGQPAPAQRETFQAQTLGATTDKGKVYWKVYGGRFSKYGVTIWPETLQAAGYDVENLDPAQTYNLAGYTATYVCKEDGKPSKVVELKR